MPLPGPLCWSVARGRAGNSFRLGSPGTAHVPRQPALNGRDARRLSRDLRRRRVAAGSADEVVAALRVAEAFGHVGGGDIAGALERCDRVLAITWRLTH